jgi:hypothetical protein
VAITLSEQEPEERREDGEEAEPVELPSPPLVMVGWLPIEDRDDELADEGSDAERGRVAA